MTDVPIIGISACFFHPDPQRPLFKGKRLLYLEESMAHWIMSGGVLAYMLPSSPPSGPSGGDPAHPDALLRGVDGLVLQGGSDVSPRSYGEEPNKPAWEGDAIRDRYEMALVHGCIKANKPVLGICRGAQLLNVALGGSLYQDIAEQVPGALRHRDWEMYDALTHGVRFEPGSKLANMYPGVMGGTINSVHHQAIRELGRGLVVEARSTADNLIEAVRMGRENEDDAARPYVYGVQWHPEFLGEFEPEFQRTGAQSLLRSRPLLDDFLSAVRRRKMHVAGH